MGASKSEPRLCGAPTRIGGKCRASAMRNARNGRCRLHGGKSSFDKSLKATKRPPPRGKTAARQPNSGLRRGQKPAPYGGAVLPNEASLFAALPVGSVDDELKLCRLRLGRAAAAEAKLIASGESEGLTRIQDEINRITTRIDRFENRRAQLLALAAAAAATGMAPDDTSDDPHVQARAIRAALDEIESVTAPDGDSSDGNADT